MKKLTSLSCLVVLLSGCSNFLQQNTPTEQTPTVVDAVEGNTSANNSSKGLDGLVDTLRQRTDPVQDDPAWAPVRPKQKPEHYAAETGSLFNPDGERGLYDDSKPHGLGDIITVNLNESTKAAKSADADLSKNNDASMDPLSVGGQELKMGNYNFSYALKNDNKFSGSSAANQSNSISGSISVQVVDVLANGNLVIRGEKWMTLNTGDEYVRLSGTVRPDDIANDNTIDSTRIANARIQYSGTGNQQDMQEPGFLARFFNVSL
ncbi:flagellar basal body L-ring protein FlgH [Vibrio sp. CAIM 722]|uniref:Flagellar L-ring protein n=1 Tax=Vibrio eleionomae TaxID=2653505 RepID=A0A7X4RSX3_9VIBR|nr:flagellar basal body L-ring protein FlgH [Vibrio eleionomae]MZI91612.1 flagellar basal body L-ring protein FlgH [Vibrio eleionomae]